MKSEFARNTKGAMVNHRAFFVCRNDVVCLI